MASLRKKKGRYYARFYDRHRSPKRKEVALGTTRKDVARRRLTEWERLYEKGAFDPWAPEPFGKTAHLSIGEAIAAFLDAKQHLRPNTLRTYRGILRRWAGMLPATLRLRDAGAEHVRPYVLQPGLETATKRKRYRHLRVFFNWARRSGYLDASPLAEVRQPKAEKKAAAFLSTGDLQKLLRCIEAHGEITRSATGRAPDDAWLSAMIQVGVGTGLRRSELVRLRWQDVDLEQRLLTVRSRDGQRTKSGHERVLPLRGSALRVLRMLDAERVAAGSEDGRVFTDRSGSPIKPGRASHRFKFFVRAARLPERERLRFHSLRHTTGSWLAMEGVPMRVIQAVLGHSTIQVTERYSHLQPEVMGAAMEATFGA